MHEISSVGGISKILCASEVDSATPIQCICENVRHSAAWHKLLVVCTFVTYQKCMVSVGYEC